MTTYLIGDVQGCDEALARLLTHIGFSPSRDTLYLLGDLVNRGPDNVGVLRRLMAYGSSAQCILGNHDLHLLAVSRGVRAAHRQDTTADILNAPDRTVLLDWLRRSGQLNKPWHWPARWRTCCAVTRWPPSCRRCMAVYQTSGAMTCKVPTVCG